MRELLKDIGMAFTLVGMFLFLVWLSGEYHESYAAELNEYEAIFASATDEDFEALEEVIYWESVRAGCDYEVSKAVAETVLNRVLTKGYPNTIYKVCHQRKQFVCKPIPDGLKETTYEAISDAVEGCVNYGREILPSTSYLFFATKKQSYAANHIWYGTTKDGKPVKGKGMYFGTVKK